MEYFTLEALPARHGDCLLLHFGSESDPRLVVIDGGPRSVWTNALQPRLAALAADPRRPAGGAIDLMMVSHIDDDHIQGIVEFLAAWIAADEDEREWPFPVAGLWHNSFERVAGADPSKVTASVLASANAPALPDVDFEALVEDEEDEAEAQRIVDNARAIVHVLAGVAQGARVRNDSKRLDITRNSGFDGLVRPGAGPQVPYDVGSGLTFHVAGPLPRQLAALQEAFADQLPPLKTLAAYEDRSVANLSSIVVLARFGEKTMLLTGDARGDYLLEGLAAEGLLTDGKLHVDILKLQHHGSDRNARQDFFEQVTAHHYVASADGLHGNPDRETFRMLIDARGPDACYSIHLTNSVASIDTMREKEWEEGRHRAIERNKKKIPKPWNAAEDAIAELIADRQRAGYRFQLVEPTAERPWPKIDLMDPVPF
jgi:hypothetical protein